MSPNAEWAETIILCIWGVNAIGATLTFSMMRRQLRRTSRELELAYELTQTLQRRHDLRAVEAHNEAGGHPWHRLNDDDSRDGAAEHRSAEGDGEA